MDALTPPTPVHGGLVHDELTSAGLEAHEILDMSVNVNPYGPCAPVIRAIREAPLHCYPDPTAAPARRALAAMVRMHPERIVLGNGAVEILWLLARASLRSGDAIVIVEPAFSEMRAAALRQRARVVEHRTLPEQDFSLDLAALDRTLTTVAPRLLYVATPSNPAGTSTPLAALGALAERHPGTLFVVDVSFLSTSTHHAALEGPLSERIVWVRSLTKDHALAGLRLGFAVAPEEVARRLEQERPPWSISGLCQAAAIAAATDEARAFVDASRVRLARDRAYLARTLTRLSLFAHPGDAGYVLADVGSGRSASSLRASLLRRHKVLIRDATSFGLPHHIRLAARCPSDVDRAALALSEELNS